MFKVYATTPETMPLDAIGAHAQRAEAMGYDGLHVPDAVHDGFLLAALALNATRKITVGTAVLVAFPRSPMQVAIAAWDLQALSQGRFELGLGTQVKANIEQRYSAQWTAPVPRLRDYISALRAIFASFQTGSRLHYVGEHYQFTKLQPFFNPGPIEYPVPPIFIGAVGPLMTALAGETADGIITHPTNTPVRYIREVVLPRLQKGAEKTGRSLDSIQLILGTLVATGKDAATVDKEKEKQRALLGFLYSTPSYWPSLELFGWAHKGEQLLQLTRAGQWAQLATVIDDAMLEEFVPCASYAEIADVLRARYRGLSSVINFPLPDNPADDAQAAQVIAHLQGR